MIQKSFGKPKTDNFSEKRQTVLNISKNPQKKSPSLHYVQPFPSKYKRDTSVQLYWWRPGELFFTLSNNRKDPNFGNSSNILDPKPVK